jgi:hypothetical protein
MSVLLQSGHFCGLPSFWIPPKDFGTRWDIMYLGSTLIDIKLVVK